MKTMTRYGVAAVVAALGLANTAFALTKVEDPNGKTVLVVDGDKVKTDGAAKTVMTIDGDKITDAGGKLVLYINGDNIRNEPNGKLLLLIDGRNIRREIGGTKLLYVDGKDLMRGDRSGKPLYHFAGDDLDSQQRMAVIYFLMPELFGATREQDSAMLAAQGKSATADDADRLKSLATGSFNVDLYYSRNSTNRSGTVTISKLGDVLAMDVKFNKMDALQGIAVQRGEEIWAAVGPPGTVGLAVYTIKDKNLAGTWYNVTGKPESFGTENMTGANPLGGDYTITDARAPFTLAPYTGKLTLDVGEKKFDDNVPMFDAAWDLNGYKAKGVGFSAQKSLILATSSAANVTAVRFKMNIKDGTLIGQYLASDKDMGLWNLKKTK